MRRGPGLVALERGVQSAEHYAAHSNALNLAELNNLRTQIEMFSNTLRNFAIAHRDEIRRNPEFRHAFQQMCASLWVDPLAGHPVTASTGGRPGKVANLWNELLGFGDWQYELGVQIVDVCVSTRTRNGGIIAVNELINCVNRLRHGKSTFSSDVGCLSLQDIERSISALQPLGCGYKILMLHDTPVIRTIPHDFSSDSISVLEYLSSFEAPRDAANVTYVTEKHAMTSMHHFYSNHTKWSLSRIQKSLQDMLLCEATLWVDVVLDLARGGENRRFYSLGLSQK